MTQLYYGRHTHCTQSVLQTYTLMLLNMSFYSQGCYLSFILFKVKVHLFKDTLKLISKLFTCYFNSLSMTSSRPFSLVQGFTLRSIWSFKTRTFTLQWLVTIKQAPTCSELQWLVTIKSSSTIFIWVQPLTGGQRSKIFWTT